MSRKRQKIRFGALAFAVCALLLGNVLATDLAILHHSQGKFPWLYAISFMLEGVGALAICAVGIHQVRTGLKSRPQLDEDLLNAFLEHVPDNVYFKDRESRFLRISKAMAERFGLADTEDALHKTDSDIFTSEHADQALADEQEIMRTGRPIIGKEEKETWPDGHETWGLTTKLPLEDHAGKIIGTMGITQDITHRKQAELRVQYLELHDFLTGLPNRLLFEDHLREAIALARRNHKRVGVLMLDLDRFGNVNDGFGHAAGDRLLQAVALRLRGCGRESDIVARVGGDEFAICLPLMEGEEDVQVVAQKVLDLLIAPFQDEGREIQLSAGIGICQFPRDGEDPTLLLQIADSAMHLAKTRGRGVCSSVNPIATETSQRERRLQNDLYKACANDEFVLRFQPFVAMDTGLITGFEALLRWRHPELGMISPGMFIPQLEELGLMVEVGRWVLKTACRQNMAWQMEGLAPVRMAVNVCSQQFFRGNLLDTVDSALSESGMNAKWLELEMTESRTLDDSEPTMKIMHGLTQLGVSLSLDDFGTGWSSLSYLRRFPISRIKIDQSFVHDLASQSSAQAVIRCILALGQNLKIECIAEGVETRQQHDYLRQQKCREAQGYLYGHPMTPADCAALLRSAQPRLKGLRSSEPVLEMRPAS